MCTHTRRHTQPPPTQTHTHTNVYYLSAMVCILSLLFLFPMLISQAVMSPLDQHWHMDCPRKSVCVCVCVCVCLVYLHLISLFVVITLHMVPIQSLSRNSV